MRYKITPVPAPRQVRSDRWKQRPSVLRYRAFRDHVKLLNIDVRVGSAITFYMPMSKSWSKKKKAKHDGQPHMSKPDLDNLIKALLDAVYKEDSQIWKLGQTKKIWAYTGAIEIT